MTQINAVSPEARAPAAMSHLPTATGTRLVVQRPSRGHQRKLGIGYNKAARLVEQMEDQGVVTPANHVGKREILIPEA